MGVVRPSDWFASRVRIALATGVLLLPVGAAFGSLRDDPFPEGRLEARGQAAERLKAAIGVEGLCLTADLQRLWQGSQPLSAEIRRTLMELSARRAPGRWNRHDSDGGWIVRYPDLIGSSERTALPDANGDGRPDLVEAVLIGLEQARQLLVEQLGLPMPSDFEVLIAETGDRADGYLLPSSLQPAPTTVVLDATPRLGLEGARLSAMHQFAHAVGRATGVALRSGWSEALADWTVVHIEGGPDADVAALLDRRLQRLDAGLFTDDPVLAAGNALWLAFLDQAYGTHVVRAAVEELARGSGPESAAMEQALARATDVDLAAAFREFQLWSVLVGQRSDGRHFSFAPLLTPPPFASAQDGLPALSVRADPAVPAFGAVQVRLVPRDLRGGLRVLFEGEPLVGWDADLLLVGRTGTLHRLPLTPSSTGRAERSVPLDGLAEALLLVRRAGGTTAERYTYSAHRDAAFPFELAAIRAAREVGGSDVFVSWETSSEERLVGFNVLRYLPGRDVPVAVNPVWIPALGDVSLDTAYHFVDRSAEPGVPYVYRVQGITRDGLTSLSPPTEVHSAR